MALKYITFLVCLPLYVFSNEYEIGYGYKVNDKLHVSGYISTEYSVGNEYNEFEFDDIALLAYGRLTAKLSYFLELEASSIYTYNFDTDTSMKNTITHIERAYLDYSFSNRYKMRVGKQITPIGYWNYEPINVLRDTTSSPVYSFRMFPKLLSGIDLYGSIMEDNHLNYHVFIQASKDLDEEALNIRSEYFYGLVLNYDIDNFTSVGASIGNYKVKNTNEIVNIFQVNAKYGNDIGEVQTEFAYNTVTDDILDTTKDSFIGYIQGKYIINEKHALVSRYEYINDYRISHIGILGYSYRPIYAISFKAEYQVHSESTYDKALMSFSVLF